MPASSACRPDDVTDPDPRLPAALEGARRARALRHARRARLLPDGAPRRPPAIDDHALLAPEPRVPGVEFHSGSLGHLLSVGVGVALDMKLRGGPTRVFVDPRRRRAGRGLGLGGLPGRRRASSSTTWSPSSTATSFQANMAHRGADPARADRREVRGVRLAPSPTSTATTSRARRGLREAARARPASRRRSSPHGAQQGAAQPRGPGRALVRRLQRRGDRRCSSPSCTVPRAASALR